MDHARKLERVRQAATWHTGPVTHAAVMGQVPAAIIDECPARLVALVAGAINHAYHAGRASCGAERVDDAVWIGAPVERLIPVAALRALTRTDGREPVPGSDLEYITHHYSLDYTERC